MFNTSVDISNRALQHLGVPFISTMTDNSKQANQSNLCYTKLRRSELTKSVWGFAVRRAVIRKIVVATTKALTFATWAVGTSYGIGDVVKDASSVFWMSNIAANVGNTPGAGGINPPWSVYFGPIVAQAWVTAIPYYPGDVVWVTSTAYICSAANTSQTPPNLTYWQPMTATLVAITLLSPIGYRPDATVLRNLYHLPNGYLRMAPLDPKAAGTVRSNVTAGMAYNDYEFEAGYLVSAAQSDPLVLRFVADQADVPTMDDVFCEALAARMAIEMAESLTQSREKLQAAVTLYDNIMTLAKMVNAIEAGTTENEPALSVAPAGGQQQER